MTTPIWICDGCGKEGTGEGWQWYASILHMETCPDDVPVACSNECMKVVEGKIKSGEYVLPKLSRGGYYCEVIEEKRGY